MKKCYKSLLCLAMAVIMLFTVGLSAFAAAEQEAQTYSSNEIITSLEYKPKGTMNDGDIVTVKIGVKNCAATPMDIQAKIIANAHSRILSVNGERIRNHKILLKDVQPEETVTVSIELKLNRFKMPFGFMDKNITYMLGDLTMIFFGFIDTLSLNCVTAHMSFADTYASLYFKATDVTA